MERVQARRPTIEIPLPSKPPDYRSGDGPALAPIRMSLPNDSGAFIVDKRVLPGKPVDGELKLELYYIVGWPDLPAARVAILATKILDYVSPWTLEDWEYKASLQRDLTMERKKPAPSEKEKEATEVRSASLPAPGVSVSLPSTAGAQKKRGRPSKAEVVARQIAQQASFGDEELANVNLPPASISGPSLSTPKKRLARLATEAEEVEETDTNEPMPKRTRGAFESESGSEDNEVYESLGELEELEEPEHGRGFLSVNSPQPGPSSRGYAQFPVSNPSSSAQEDLARPKSPPPRASDFSLEKPLRWTKHQLTTPIPASSYPEIRRKDSARVQKFTPVPPPVHQWAKPQPKSSAIPPPRRESLVPTPKIPMQQTGSQTPVPPPTVPHPASRPPREMKKTPVPVPAAPLKANPSTSNTTSSTPVPVPIHPLLHKSGKTPQSGHSQVPPEQAITPSNNRRSQREKPKPAPEEPVWEVEWLEDDRIVEIDGQSYRYFKVRWAGDWPPDQNPTWEPEDNIPEKLVTNYLKNRKRWKRRQSMPVPSTQPPPKVRRLDGRPKRKSSSSLMVERKYSSVMEAFEGGLDVEGDDNNQAGRIQEEEEEEEDEEEEERLEVVERRSQSTSVSVSGTTVGGDKTGTTTTPMRRLGPLDPAFLMAVATRITTRFGVMS
ncbi:hypothetical protein F5Y17DRAFT_126859 [Xylariaceae sp. FL0594]|nr:hypothetical protein F5Y17DRAFT_126859 [Xylariaceae sp. FL0594]